MGNNERNTAMFIKLRMMAHEALKEYMHGNHPPLYGDTTSRIYDIIRTAETSEAFANSFDMECAEAFDEQTAEGYDDLVMLLSSKKYMPEDLRDLLKRYSIIVED